MKKRLFIESDHLTDDELNTCRRTVRYMLKDAGIDFIPEVFDEVATYAWHEGEKAWAALLRADEVYANTSFVGLCGMGTYTGAPVVFDRMMKASIDQGITGKEVYILRPFEDVDWDAIDVKLFAECFKPFKNKPCNKIFTLEEGRVWHRVDIPSVRKAAKK